MSDMTNKPQSPTSKKTERILAEIKARRERDDVIRMEEEKVKLVICSLGGTYYAFYGSDIREILRHETIAFVPGCPDYIMGIINVRGDIESVVELHRLIGLKRPEITRHSRIVIAARGESRTGILVDAVADVLDVPASRIQPPISNLPDAVKPFAAGGEKLYEDHYVTLLDVGKIFNELYKEVA